MIKREKILPRTVAVLIFLTMMFIWRNSTLDRDASAGESDAVRGWLESFLSYDSAAGAFILKHLRKIAHFLEFGLLGAETCLYSHLIRRSSAFSLAASAIFGLFVAAADETIQIFTGRGASVRDVMLDFSGFLTFGALTEAAMYFLSCLRKKKEC